MRVAEHSLPMGTILGETSRYRILQPLDAYDRWTVYLTEPVGNAGPQTALKVTDAGSLRAEARRLSGVAAEAPSLFPAFYGLFQDGPFSCMAMEYIHGHSLYDALFGSVAVPGNGPFSKGEVIRIGLQLASAAMTLHGRRLPLIFCGFRPENIFLEQRPSGRIYLPDLSVARPYSRMGYESPVLEIRGPEGYMPSYDQTISPGTDIYGLGATLWILLTGEESWQERGLLSTWSLSPLVRLLRSMVSNHPRRRPMSMEAVHERLLGMDTSSKPKKPASALGVPKGNPTPPRASAIPSNLTSSPQRTRLLRRRSGMWR